MGGLLQRIGVQPAERMLFARAALCLVLLGAAGIALMNTAETLFLKRVGVERLPLALLASSLLLVATTALVGRLARPDPPRWLPRVLVALAVALAPFAVLADSQAPLVFGALVLMSRQVMALAVLAFWVAMGSLVPARRSKQLFGPLGSGITLGAILGSFGSKPVADWLGLDGLIGLCAALLLAAALVARGLRQGGTRRLAGGLAVATVGGAVATPAAGLVELLRGNRLFRLLAVSLLCGGALSPVLYFQFSSVLDLATQGPGGEQRLLGLFAQFRGWLNVAMLVSQLWLSGALYRRFGLPLSMALWPAAYLLGFTWMGLDVTLRAAFGSLGTARVSEEGVSEPAARVLYNLFPDELRASASGLLGGPVNRLGGALGNGAVLAALAAGSVAWVGWAALPVAGLWLASGLVLWRAYPGLLLRASAEHGLAGAGSDRATLLDAATLRSLAESLEDPDPRVCRAALDLMVDGEASEAVRLLAGAVATAPAANRALVVETLRETVEPLPPGRAWSADASDSLAACLAARPRLPDEERADLLQVYARLTGGADAPEPVVRDSLRLLRRALGDPAAPVRLVAAAELHRRGHPPPGLPDLDRTLADALSAPDALVRRAARKALRALLLGGEPDDAWARRLAVLAHHLEQRADRADTAEALEEVARRHPGRAAPVARDAMRFVEDRDPRVRGALLTVAGHAGLTEEAPRLVASLAARAPGESECAREGLVALGAEAALPLLVGLEFGGPVRREAVLGVLRELEVDGETLDRLRERQLDAVNEAVLWRHSLEGVEGAAAALLRRRLEERVDEGLGALLDLLSALHDDPRLAELERRLRRAGTGRGRDLVVEGIEALLDREERGAVVPLLEPGDWAARGGAAARALGRARIPGAAGALEELRDCGEADLRLLAAAVSLEGQGAIGDPAAMPSALDIAVRLQEVPAFDRLATPQLMALAELLQEQRVAEGERVYRAGEEGLGLYFVMEGEVELRRDGLVLERVGPGSFFGELSSLDGVPRSADAMASGPARLMRLDREDLLRLLDEAPGLALGLAQFLTARVRRLEDRLAEESGGAATGDEGDGPGEPA